MWILLTTPQGDETLCLYKWKWKAWRGIFPGSCQAYPRSLTPKPWLPLPCPELSRALWSVPHKFLQGSSPQTGKKEIRRKRGQQARGDSRKSHVLKEPSISPKPPPHRAQGSVLDIRCHQGISPVVQRLRLRTPKAGGPGSTHGQGTRSHMSQLRVCMPQRRSRTSCATTKIWLRWIFF